ncbi:hypothetical protein UFOVP257_95 [uncultured Caudovirales phage]|uniref:Uncharacterized protein n=1 Tax=uncultured Caudovirales phage TaxID=2100421 RepID=A0A6J5LGJ4_9CAUD|nr:hypothetical protein UFOVP257_95 [uncultured Caudovirales phage]
MNDRIKQLERQATETVKCGLNGTSTAESFNRKKFAELIVAECINEIAYIGKANEVFGDRTDRGGLNHILWTTETAIEKIKQHFGVEE